MSLEKTKKLVEWLEINHQNQQFNFDDMKELVSIAIAELKDQSDKSFDFGIPSGYMDSIIESMKASGEYYLLENKIASFKARFTESQEKEN